MTAVLSTLPSCMGGWCTKRNNCARYQASGRPNPIERICAPGQDGLSMEYPVVMRMPAGSWERGAGSLLAPAQPMEIA